MLKRQKQNFTVKGYYYLFRVQIKLEQSAFKLKSSLL